MVLESKKTVKKVGTSIKQNELTIEHVNEILLDEDWNDVPCLICPVLEKCGLNQEINPVTCSKMNMWLEKITKEYIESLEYSEEE